MSDKEAPPTPQEIIGRACERLSKMQSLSAVAAQPDLRRLVGLCWPYIDYYTRSRFVTHLDDELLYVKPDWVESRGDPFLDHILRFWHVMPAFAQNNKERAFIADVAKRVQSSGWRPSPKQEDWIRRLWIKNIGNCYYDDRVQETPFQVVEW